MRSECTDFGETASRFEGFYYGLGSVSTLT